MYDGGASFGISIEGWREVSRGPGFRGDWDQQQGLGGCFDCEGKALSIYITED